MFSGGTLSIHSLKKAQKKKHCQNEQPGMDEIICQPEFCFDLKLVHVCNIYIIIKNNLGLLMDKLPMYMYTLKYLFKTCNKSYITVYYM